MEKSPIFHHIIEYHHLQDIRMSQILLQGYRFQGALENMQNINSESVKHSDMWCQNVPECHLSRTISPDTQNQTPKGDPLNIISLKNMNSSQVNLRKIFLHSNTETILPISEHEGINQIVSHGLSHSCMSLYDQNVALYKSQPVSTVANFPPKPVYSLVCSVIFNPRVIQQCNFRKREGACISLSESYQR